MAVTNPWEAFTKPKEDPLAWRNVGDKAPVWVMEIVTPVGRRRISQRSLPGVGAQPELINVGTYETGLSALGTPNSIARSVDVEFAANAIPTRLLFSQCIPIGGWAELSLMLPGMPWESRCVIIRGHLTDIDTDSISSTTKDGPSITATVTEPRSLANIEWLPGWDEGCDPAGHATEDTQASVGERYPYGWGCVSFEPMLVGFSFETTQEVELRQALFDVDTALNIVPISAEDPIPHTYDVFTTCIQFAAAGHGWEDDELKLDDEDVDCEPGGWTSGESLVRPWDLSKPEFYRFLAATRSSSTVKTEVTDACGNPITVWKHTCTIKQLALVEGLYVVGINSGFVDLTWAQLTTNLNTNNFDRTLIQPSFVDTLPTLDTMPDADTRGVVCATRGGSSVHLVDIMREMLTKHLPLCAIDDAAFARAKQCLPGMQTVGLFVDQAGGIDMVEDELLAEFDMVHMCWSGDGYGPVVVDRRKDPKLTLTVGVDLFERLPGLSPSDPEDLPTEHSIFYAWDEDQGAFTKSQAVRPETATDSTRAQYGYGPADPARSGQLARLRAVVGDRPAVDRETRFVKSDAVAGAILDWRIAHYSTPSVVASYVGPWWLVKGLQKGDTIAVRDPSMNSFTGESELTAIVDRITLADCTVTLVLRMWVCDA